MNWASVAKSEPPKAAPVKSGGARPSFVVLDANALITQHGLLNLALAEKVVTTPEVLREVRDKQSRSTLDALPFTLEQIDPLEDSVKAGMSMLIFMTIRDCGCNAYNTQIDAYISQPTPPPCCT